MAQEVVATEIDPEWERASRDLFETYADAMEMVREHPSFLRFQVNLTLKLVPLYDLVSEESLSKIIPTLVTCVRSKEEESDPRYVALLVAAVHGLTHIACRGNGRLASQIATSGAIGFMVEILESNDITDAFLQVLLKCLWVLVSFGGELCCKALILSRGVQAVTSLLSTPRAAASTRRYLLEILSALAMVKPAQKWIVQLGGLGYLVEAVGIGSMASRERACQAIGLIGASSNDLGETLAEMGAIPLLINMFNEGDRATKTVAANALGLALTNVGYIRAAAQAGAIPLYAQLLRGGVYSTEMEIAVDAFCLLSIAEENAVSIAEHMVGILKDGRDYAKESACHVLWDIAAYEHSVHVIQDSGALDVMLELLRGSYPDGYSTELEEGLCSVIAKLSSYKVHRSGLVEAGAVRLLVDIFVKYADTSDPYDCLCKRYAAKAIKNLLEDPDYRDRVSEEIGDESLLQEFEGEMSTLELDHLLESDSYAFEVDQMREDDDDDDEIMHEA